MIPGLLAFALLHAGTAILSAPVGAASPPAITHPDWLKRPSAANMYDVWPAGAYYAHVKGHVVLHCVVNEKGRLKQCVAITDEPKGWGFGGAALEMAGQFQMKPMTADGVPVAGGVVNVPIEFGFEN